MSSITSQSIKRSYSSSPTPTPSTTPKKFKSTPYKTKKTPPSTPGSPTKASSNWTNEKKAILVKKCMDTAYKTMDWAELAAETGMTKDQCKDQMKPGRSNVRKLVSELFTK
ncbi:hypothetical protein CI109_102485 [Kwoniella shandongensis]|uniref:Uncharacterized protein n=1 Tax=Kwoniella shandongensis TaxID=1734106 RepID=A0A5M6C539_9TREE|nr:uncharacterized protein CI109_003197 [Kwoniella shandongensis]KAA5528299.1 hypothetical protein CI109_003197 [Kwoniella shandongensis]